MPAGDKTGPNGKGSRTGRGLGYCAGYPDPGFTKSTRRESFRRLGRNYSRSRGNRRFKNS